MDFKRMTHNIREHLKKYLLDSSLKSVVVGLSGGIDSALCAALASSVCRELSLPLIGRFLMIESNRDDERIRGELCGAAFCDDYQTVDLTEAYLPLLPHIEEEAADPTSYADKIRRGNIKARLRMIYLYNIAGKRRGLVLSTDNYTELLLGFWTLHGDVGDYGMIQSLWKGEVYDLAEHLAAQEGDGVHKKALRECIDATPTDGLGITSSDLEQLEAGNYREVDETLQRYLVEGDAKGLNRAVIDRHLRSTFKRENPLNLSRDKLFNGINS